MRTCRSCGGVLGRDCFNEQECMLIDARQRSVQDQNIEHSQTSITELWHDNHILTSRIETLEGQVKFLIDVLRKLSPDSFVPNNDDLPF